MGFACGKIEQLSGSEFLGLALGGEGDSPFQALHCDFAGNFVGWNDLACGQDQPINSKVFVFTRVAVFELQRASPNGKRMTSPGLAWEIDIKPSS